VEPPPAWGASIVGAERADGTPVPLRDGPGHGRPWPGRDGGDWPRRRGLAKTGCVRQGGRRGRGGVAVGLVLAHAVSASTVV
jgi:hypothetical protein